MILSLPRRAARRRVLSGLAAALSLAACTDRNPASPPARMAEGAAVMTTGTGTVATWTPAGWSVDLGTLGGKTTHAAGLNEAGQVVGTSELVTYERRAFVWTPSNAAATAGTMIALPLLPGTAYSDAYSINESGYIAGTSAQAQGGFRATLWVPGAGGYTAVDLGVLGPTGRQSHGTAVNDAGQVVGRAESAPGVYAGFLWTPSSPAGVTGTMRSLGDFEPVAINNAGTIVGTRTVNGKQVPHLWLSGAAAAVPMEFASLAPFTGFVPQAMNDAGQVSGNLSGASRRTGVWDPSAPGSTQGTVRTLPGDSAWWGGFGSGINDLGHVAGSRIVQAGASLSWVAGVWTGGVMRLFYPAVGSTASAVAVSNNGRVACTVLLPSGERRPVLLTSLPPAEVTVSAALSARLSQVSGEPFVYDASGSIHSHGGWLTFAWDTTGDGVTDMSSGITPRIALARQPGTYTVGVVVRAVEGPTARASITVTVVRNLAPVITMGPVPAPVPEGTTLSPTFSVADVDDSTFRYTWAWGDGTTSEGVSSKKYADQGWYPVRLIVRDPGGRADTARIRLTVTNAPPVAHFWSTTTVQEGTPYVLQLAHPADPGTGDQATLQFAFDCGAGGGWGPFGPSPTVTCPGTGDQRSLVMYGRVRDKDGGETTYLRRAGSVNVRPRVVAQALDVPGLDGAVRASFTDPGWEDAPWEWRVLWGDGSSTPWSSASPGVPLDARHTYHGAGAFNGIVQVRDRDGAVGAVAVTIAAGP
jgi:probable HAF family extracellular repeat protein